MVVSFLRKLIFQTRITDAQLAWTFAGRLCDKYHNLMSWLK